MSIHPNVTTQGLIVLVKLTEQQKNQRAEKIKERILEQTRDIWLAEIFTPICKTVERANDSPKIKAKEFKNNSTSPKKHQTYFSKVSKSNTKILSASNEIVKTFGKKKR